MALTRNNFTGNGLTTNYTFGWNYINTTDVLVTINGTATTDFTVTGSVVTFNTAPADQSAIVIFRDTNNDNMRAEFQAGSAIRAADLNDNYKQTLFVTQEADATSIRAETNSINAVNTANTAETNSVNAVNTSNTANSTANTALATISDLVIYDGLNFVNDIPAVPDDNKRYEVQNSSGIESFSPITGLPANFIGSSDLRVRIRYNANESTYVFVSYDAVDPENQYVRLDKVAKSDPITVTVNNQDVTYGITAATQAARGSMSAADKTKIDGIEDNATQDQTAAEIRTLVEAATDSNVFTDADHSKLDGIEANATQDQTAAEIRTLVGSATDSNVFTDADHTKLDGIEANATQDQTAAEILTAIKTVDGSGSGLDADLLDGQQGSYYRNASNLNAGTIADARLPNTISSDITGTASGNLLLTGGTLTGDLTIPSKILHSGDSDTYIQFDANDKFRVVCAGNEVQEWGNNYTLINDNDTLRFGTGSDFQIHFNGADTFFRNLAHANGDVVFQGETSAGSNQNIHILKTDGTRTYNILFENNQERFRTTSTGVTVTGTATATSFAGTGGSITGINASNISSGTIADARIPDTITPATLVTTKEVRTSTGQELILNAGESAGKIGSQTGELVYVNAESGLRVCTPSVANWGSGYVEMRTNITGNGIYFHQNSTAMGEITVQDGTWLRINQSTNKNIYTPRYIRADAGFFVDGTTKGINGSGNFIGGTIAGASDVTDASTANTVVKRNASSDINCRLVRPNYANNTTISGAIAYRVNNSTDNYIRFCSDKAAIRTFLGVTATAVDANYLRSNATDQFDGQTSGRTMTFRCVDGRNAANSSGNLFPLQIYQASNVSNSDAAMTFHIAGRHATYFGLNRETNDLFVGGWSKGSNKYRIYHEGNTIARSSIANVFEINRYIDFHTTTTGTDDFNFRLDNNQADNLKFSGRIQTRGSSNTESILVDRSASYAAQLLIGGWNSANSTNIARIRCSTNLHIDSPANGNLYFNWYASGKTILIGNTGATVLAAGNNTVWHSGNDGSGSGLDADSVDGIQASSFLRSDATDTASGTITFNGRVNIRGHLNFADEEYAYFGNDDDTTIRHNSNGWTYVDFRVGNGFIFRDNGGDRIVLEDGGVFRPNVNNQRYLGTSSYYWYNIYGTYINAGLGSVGGPSYRFGGDTDTGLYRVSSNVLGFVAGGARRGSLGGDNVSFQGVYTATQSGGTEVRVDSAGRLRRHSSSRKTKTNIEPMEVEYAYKILDQVEPIWYRPRVPDLNYPQEYLESIEEQLPTIDGCTAYCLDNNLEWDLESNYPQEYLDTLKGELPTVDGCAAYCLDNELEWDQTDLWMNEGVNPNYSYWGFVAEDLAEIDPRLCSQNPETGEYDSVQYGEFTPLLLKIAQEQKAQITNLEQRLQALETKLIESEP